MVMADLAVAAGGDLAPEGVVAPGELDDVGVRGSVIGALCPWGWWP
jgi:hypothetical protein